MPKNAAHLCPSLEQIERNVAGLRNPRQIAPSDEIANHIAHCHACHEVAERVRRNNSLLNPYLDGALSSACPPQAAGAAAKPDGPDGPERENVDAIPSATEAKPQFDKSETIATAPTEQSGAEIDGYRLLEKIGEGGFGTVWMAEQRHPVQRRVALKIVKLGMDTRQVIARFEQERQALALMDHPNIARVFDAGATTSGRPYFVMELVRGRSITAYCDERKLPLRRRLDLLRDVCHAVQHAHAKGIIHRDIKPSNVIVSQHDDKPAVKVIDFGIAKATTGRLTDRTLFTEFHQVIGTPAYMSPEQAGMSDLDIDTRSDVYSLGVLLYELLTGDTPFDSKRLRSAGYDEMRRIIREEEPPRPSTRLSGAIPMPATRNGGQAGRWASGADDSSSSAGFPSHLRTFSPFHPRSVRGDLDWITLKCLEKDRTRRYETPSALAADVQRHLAGEPVIAAPPSSAYRARKFVRRNRALVTGGAIVASVLLVGILGTSWQAVRANRAADAAQRLNDFYTNALGGLDTFELELREFDAIHTASGDVRASEILLRAAANIGDAFVDRPDLELEVRRVLGQALCGTGKWEDGIGQLRGAYRLSQAHLPYATEKRVVIARALGARLFDENNKRLSPETLLVLQDASDLARSAYGDSDVRTAITQSYLAWALTAHGRAAEGDALFRKCIAIAEPAVGGEHRHLVHMLAGVGYALVHRGKLDEALTYSRRAFELCPQVYPRYTAGWTQAIELHLQILSMADRMEDSVTVARTLLASIKSTHGFRNPTGINLMPSLLFAFCRAGLQDEAEELARSAVAQVAAEHGDESVNAVIATEVLSFCLLQGDKLDEALQLAQTALTKIPDIPEYAGVRARTAATLASILVKMNQATAAEFIIGGLAQGLVTTPLEIRMVAYQFPLLRGAMARRMAAIGQFETAEWMLLDDHDSVCRRAGPNSESARAAATELVGLYQSWGKPDRLAEWRVRAEQAGP